MNFSFFHGLYRKSLADNEKNTNFWEKYIQDLNMLDFKIYDEKLTVPALIPIGGRLMFRGELRHTNEITVALGADYFVTCSSAQAEVLRKHRIQKAESALNLLKKEKEYLENQIAYGKRAAEDEGHDIIEVCTEEEDKAWRKQHRDKVKQYMQRKDKNDEKTNEITDKELWDRLEELELQEELQNELSNTEREDIHRDDLEVSSKDESSNNEAESQPEKIDENVDSDDDSDDVVSDYNIPREQLAKKIRSINETYSQQTLKPSVLTQPKLELMNEMVERHNIIAETLKEFKKKKEYKCHNIDDLLRKMEELEEAEELEDEMDRIEDLMNDSDEQDNDDEAVHEEGAESKLKKSVSFADEDSSETLEITFKHSDEEPTIEPYSPERGIIKPNDIYEAFSKKHTEAASILKKTANYTIPAVPFEVQDGHKQETHTEIPQKTIVVKDIVEKVDQNDNNTNKDGRPMSLFKKRRQQKKS